MYILKAKGILKKSDYDGLDRHLVIWRLDGSVSWDAIADGSGRGLIGDFDDFQDPKTWIREKVESLKNATEEYHKLLNEQWRWYGQPKFIEYMTEKQAVTGTIHAYVKKKYVKLSYNRGNNAWGWAYRYAKKLRKELYYTDVETGEHKRREEVYIKYLGDDDTYGRHMDLELRNQLKEFGILNKIKFERIAVLPHQVNEYGIPRADEGEGGGYDIDALNAYRPDLFEKLLLDNIEDCFDEDIHEKVLEKFSEEHINKIVNDKVQFLEGGGKAGARGGRRG